MEEWRDIKCFEGQYQVSNKGNIKSLERTVNCALKNCNAKLIKERILKPKINKKGYLEVTLSKNDKCYYRLVSRLVFETFTGQKLGKNDILMYKDKDKTNCSIDNLYLITRGKRQEITYDNDKRYRPKYEFYDEVLSTKEISKKTGIEPKLIRTRISKLCWSIYEARRNTSSSI